MCVLGGVGPEIIKTADGAAQDLGALYTVAYTHGGEGFGWNNEYYEFDMNDGKVIYLLLILITAQTIFSLVPKHFLFLYNVECTLFLLHTSLHVYINRFLL